MSNEKPKIIAFPKWKENATGYYGACEVQVFNLTDEALQTPEVIFELSAGQSPQVHSRFSFTAEGLKVKGKMEQSVPAKGSATFIIGIGGPSSTLGELPKNFLVNNMKADSPEDKIPPTIPTKIKVADAGPRTISLQWAPSEDELIVVGYNVLYKDLTTSKEFRAVTNEPSIHLAKLQSSTSYQIQISAFDAVNNVSNFSPEIIARTTEPLPDPGSWMIRRAPFIDYTAYPTPYVSLYSQESDLDGYFIGFLVCPISSTDGKVCWGGYSSIADSHNTDDTFSGEAAISNYGKKDIEAFRKNGGEVIFSFGGASNVPVEEVEKDIQKITDTYEKIIENYKLTYIDFDFEGNFLKNIEAIDRHIAAIVRVLKRNHNLKISYTLPVDGAPGSLEGFNPDGVSLLQKIAGAGLQPSLINGMLMEFGEKSAPYNTYECCIFGLKGMFKHISEAFPEWSEEKVWRRMGACPMFGTHINKRVFTLEHQRKLVEFATEKNLGCLSGWDATRDRNQGFDKMCDNLQGNDMSKCTYVDQKPFDFAKIISTYEPKE